MGQECQRKECGIEKRRFLLAVLETSRFFALSFLMSKSRKSNKRTCSVFTVSLTFVNFSIYSVMR